jgi:plastocyanin
VNNFTPSRIEVKRGEQIRFVVRNVGSEDHEFLLATTEENLKHAELHGVPREMLERLRHRGLEGGAVRGRAIGQHL